MSKKVYKLSEIAELLDLSLDGDGEKRIVSINNLKNAKPSELSFYYSKKFKKDLKNTKAGAIILSREDDFDFSGSKLYSDQVHLVYAQCSQLFEPEISIPSFKDEFSKIHESAKVNPNSSIGAFSVIEKEVQIEEGVFINSGVYIGAGTIIKKNSKIYSNVSLYPDSMIGKNCIIHSGTVIGSDGLGFAKNGKKWEKIIHSGKVIIGDNVEIGAGCTIDKASSGSTEICNGVKLDNQIHLAHNCYIGENTIIGANTSIAGSVKIGNNCVIGGLCGIVDNIQITDEVTIYPMTFVTNNVKNKGAYSGGPILMEHKNWLKKSATLRKK